MSVVLGTAQREQAGSDSYNRFEYQAHWIVYHIINQLEKSQSVLYSVNFMMTWRNLLMEMVPNLSFIKLKKKKTMMIGLYLSFQKREKRKMDLIRNLFLAFIFYNFLKFGDECSCCHFVSNNNYDLDVRTWQSYIEDNKCLADENIKLYDKIKHASKMNMQIIFQAISMKSMINLFRKHLYINQNYNCLRMKIRYQACF